MAAQAASAALIGSSTLSIGAVQRSALGGRLSGTGTLGATALRRAALGAKFSGAGALKGTASRQFPLSGKLVGTGVVASQTTMTNQRSIGAVTFVGTSRLDCWVLPAQDQMGIREPAAPARLLPPPPPRIYPGDRHIRRDGDSYAHALAHLLPQGIAWPRQPNTILMMVVRGLCGVFGYVDGRAADLLERESDPRKAIELLPDWERNWGLPDPCYAGPLTITERQRHLIVRMTLLGGQSREFFINVAAFLGYHISISEYRPFMVGVDRCGDNREHMDDGSLADWPAQIGDPADIRFAWTVHVYKVALTWFRAGQGQCGTSPHLKIAFALDLECVIKRWRPAHTEVLFDYSGVTPNDDFAGTP